jgi:hypothetical protein
MRRTLTALVLASVLCTGLWPWPSIAEETPAIPALGGALEQEAPAAITLSPGFSQFTAVSGLTDPHGVVAFPPFPSSDNWRSGYYVVETSLNRVSFALQRGTPESFATGLSNPTDLVAPRNSGTSFGSFLYVAEASANRISKISNVGAVAPFASLPASPERMAFAQGGGFANSTFGDVLFVTLADGRLVKVDPSGTVSPCVSGLSGPKGLVFGPGGALRTTVLYVAQSTLNKISKVDASCNVSDFATTNLASPTGLGISLAAPWGPLDTTLYVVNAGTRIDRIDKNGNVTLFASGFTQTDTIRFDAFMPVDDRFNANLRIADTGGGAAGAGMIVEANVVRPSVTVALTGCTTCQVGQTFTVTLTLANNSPISVPVELKTGLQFFDGTPLNLGTPIPKHFEATLPVGFSIGPLIWLSVPWPGVSSTLPAGRYCFQASLTDPEIAVRSLANSRSCFVSLP